MTPSISREELARLRQDNATAALPVKEGWRDLVLTVFVAGRVWNPQEGARIHPAKRARIIHDIRARTAAAVGRFSRGPFPASRPKRILFTVYSFNLFDPDNLRAVCKPYLDALGQKFNGAGVIDDDRESAGHEISYANMCERKKDALLGVAIRIARREHFADDPSWP
jgi:hypothetical protein